MFTFQVRFRINYWIAWNETKRNEIKRNKRKGKERKQNETKKKISNNHLWWRQIAPLPQVPDDCKKANITQVFKEGSRTAARNYRTISLTSVPCEIMEHIILHHIMAHFDTHRILTDFQQGLRQGRHPCETQPSTITEKLARNVDHIIKAKPFEKSQYTLVVRIKNITSVVIKGILCCLLCLVVLYRMSPLKVK